MNATHVQALNQVLAVTLRKNMQKMIMECLGTKIGQFNYPTDFRLLCTTFSVYIRQFEKLISKCDGVSLQFELMGFNCTVNFADNGRKQTFVDNMFPFIVVSYAKMFLFI